MNIEEYIKSFTDKPFAYYASELEPNKYEIIIVDLTKYSYKVYIDALEKLVNSSSAMLFFIGGIELVYFLIKHKAPIVLFENDTNISVLVTYGNKYSLDFDAELVPKMNYNRYIQYINLWNEQGNRNIICPKRFLDSILWNRCNPDNVKFI